MFKTFGPSGACVIHSIMLFLFQHIVRVEGQQTSLTLMSESLNRDNITRNQGKPVLTMAVRTMGTTLIHPSPSVNAISIDPLGNLHWSPCLLSDPVPYKKHSIPVLVTSREVKQKFLVIWEGLEPWCFLFHILFLSTPLSGHMNNAKDLVAWGALGDGFKQSPLPGAITSEGKSS